MNEKSCHKKCADRVKRAHKDSFVKCIYLENKIVNIRSLAVKKLQCFGSSEYCFGDVFGLQDKEHHRGKTKYPKRF